MGCAGLDTLGLPDVDSRADCFAFDVGRCVKQWGRPIWLGMAKADDASLMTVGAPSKGSATYRGVRLQCAEAGSRLTPEQVRRAVAGAVSKHADALAGRVKA